jgi:uncharacterized cupredoxin-like copper-binding protein
MNRRGRVAILMGLLAWSCAGGGALGVTLDEFSVRLAEEQSRAGMVTFSVRNGGNIDHDFVVLRTRRKADELPVTDQQVRLLAPGVRLVDKLTKVRPDSEETLTVRLDPGSYVLVCDVPGHYQAGMRASFRVLTGS